MSKQLARLNNSTYNYASEIQVLTNWLPVSSWIQPRHPFLSSSALVITSADSEGMEKTLRTEKFQLKSFALKDKKIIFEKQKDFAWEKDEALKIIQEATGQLLKIINLYKY